MAFHTIPPAWFQAGCWTLSILCPDDWSLVAALSRDRDVVRWAGHPPNLARNEAVAVIAQGCVHAAQGFAYRYVIGDAVGPVGIASILIGRHGVPEVAYSVLRKARRRGAASAAVSVLAKWALDADWPLVYAAIASGNSISSCVARRAGFSFSHQEEREHPQGSRVMDIWLRGPSAPAPATGIPCDGEVSTAPRVDPC